MALMSSKIRATNETSLTADREQFEFHSKQYWAEIAAGNSKNANAEERAATKLAAKHEKNGDLIEFLHPFLLHASPEVRLSSAARLLKSDAREIAISALNELLSDPTLIAVSAGTILRINGITTK